MKKYRKPRFSFIKISCEELMDFGDIYSNEPGYADTKAQTSRIFDDSFDDMSSAEESDYTITSNTAEVW